MDKKTKIAIGVVAAVILVVASFLYFKKGVAPEPSPEGAQQTSPLAGCYMLKISKDVYTLVIQSQEGEKVSGMLAFNNYQKDSSSGSFEGLISGDILQGNYSFDSEGSHSDRQVIFKKTDNGFVEGFGPADVVNGKEIFTDTSKVDFDPKYTFVKLDTCVNLFTEDNGTFSFFYNPYFFAYEGERFPTTDWRLNARQNGLVLANVVIPRTFLPGTNFIEARFRVGRSTEPEAILNCSKIDNTLENNFGTETISGYPFVKTGFIGAATGNTYETISYRGIFDGDCYSFEFTMRSANIGNYSPDQDIKEFDKAKVLKEAETILRSFKFLISSD